MTTGATPFSLPAAAFIDPYGAATHEVFNQPVELGDYNLYDSDLALMEAVTREGAGWATNALVAFGAKAGSAEFSSLARSPTGIRPTSTPTTAMAGASTSSVSIPHTTR